MWTNLWTDTMGSNSPDCLDVLPELSIFTQSIEFYWVTFLSKTLCSMKKKKKKKKKKHHWNQDGSFWPLFLHSFSTFGSYIIVLCIPLYAPIHNSYYIKRITWQNVIADFLPRDMSSSSKRLMPSSCEDDVLEGNSEKDWAEGEVSSPVKSKRAVLPVNTKSI